MNEESSFTWTPEARLALAERLWDWKPHPGQRELLTLRLDDGSEPRVLVAACGRRWGKTEALGCDIATRMLTDPGLCQMGVAPTVDQAAGLMDSVEEKLREVQEDPDLLAEFPHAADWEFKRSPYPHVRNKRTRQVVFSCRSAGRGGRNLRGKGTTRKLKRFRVIIDERAYVADAAVEQAIKPMLATVPHGGGQLVEISSPNGRRGGFYDDFLRGERCEGRYRSVRLPSQQNPLVDGEFLAEMRAEMTDAAYRAEFEAEFLDAAGAVFAQQEIDAALCADDYGAAPLWGVTYVAGIDFARRSDWTVCAVLAVEPGCARLVDLFRVQGLGYAPQVDRLAETLARWGCRRATADRTGVGDPVCEQLATALAAKQFGCGLEEFVFTPASKAALIDGVVLRLGLGELRFPPHPVLLSELRNFEAVSQEGSSHERLQAARGHDDCVCALALAVRAAAPYLTRSSGGLVVATGGPRRNSGRAVFGRGKETEITCSDSRIGSIPWWGGLPAAVLAGPFLSRTLTRAYRCAPGRRAGACLARIMKRRRR